MPDISKMMTISTAHITKESADWLDQHADSDEFVVYAKGNYGWFIPVIRDVEIMAEAVDIAPADVISCIAYAEAAGCDWLCLDRDYDQVEELATYEW